MTFENSFTTKPGLMKSFTLLFSLFIVSITSLSQDKTDSTRYYSKELHRLEKSYKDSFRNSPKTKELSEKLKYAEWASDNYSGMVYYIQFGSANYDVLNADNSTDGFGPISGPMISFGLGYSLKKRRAILDLSLAGTVNKKTGKSKEVIKTSVSPLLQADIGYDLVKKKNINIYPYAGLGLRSSFLEYKAPAQTNPSPTSISNIIANNRSVKERVTEFGYQAGVGLEYKILFLKLGTNRAFKRKAFEIEGVNYDPKLQYGNWIITVGFKIVGRWDL